MRSSSCTARIGEDGRKLLRFPVMFAFDDWLRNVPETSNGRRYATSGRQYFSEYGPDGRRYCKTYAPVERDPRAQRARRSFGGRMVIHRQDDDIPDGICDPHACPQYQDRKCNLSGDLFFVIPEIKGLGLIELPTNSIYVLQKRTLRCKLCRSRAGVSLARDFGSRSRVRNHAH